MTGNEKALNADNIQGPQIKVKVHTQSIAAMAHRAHPFSVFYGFSDNPERKLEVSRAI